jgi:GR25 family glycosyltransferase involved in LPS biosynthesis
MENIYKLVDEIYCINLISRNDRYLHMKKFEHEQNIKLNFYRPVKHPDGGKAGCFASHISIIKNAYYSNKKIILIFEDDIIKMNSDDKINYNDITEFIKKNNKWEMINLGWLSPYNSIFFPMNESKNISQFNSMYASSYIINRRGMKKVLDTYEDYIFKYHVDNYYKVIFKDTMYNITPIIFNQDRNYINDNIWNNQIIDKILIYIDTNTDIVYNLSLFKYYNFCILIYLIIVFIICRYLYKLKISKLL